jgi:hypothetical protein
MLAETVASYYPEVPSVTDWIQCRCEWVWLAWGVHSAGHLSDLPSNPPMIPTLHTVEQPVLCRSPHPSHRYDLELWSSTPHCLCSFCFLLFLPQCFPVNMLSPHRCTIQFSSGDTLCGALWTMGMDKLFLFLFCREGPNIPATWL